jgi:molybdenum-dependent DNA-binding transcriptional regulator ModE
MLLTAVPTKAIYLLRLLTNGSTLGHAAEQTGLSYSNAGVRLHRMRRRFLDLLGSPAEKIRSRL